MKGTEPTYPSETAKDFHHGISIRAHFSEIFMCALVKNNSRMNANKIADKAVKLADALILRLNK